MPGNEKTTLPKMKTSSKQSTHRETSTELRLSQWFSFRPLELTYFLMRDLLARDIGNWEKKKKKKRRKCKLQLGVRRNASQERDAVGL